MEEFISSLFKSMSWPLLLGVVAVLFYVLSKGADRLVTESVSLSLLWNVPKAVIGATVVSLGTTLPEMVVSVSAALEGKPDVALGNAVGSIICNTGLVLGLAALISPLSVDRAASGWQSRYQNAACLVLIIASWPLLVPVSAFSIGGVLPRMVGFVFLFGLLSYVWTSVRKGREDLADEVEKEAAEGAATHSASLIGLKLVFAIALVVLSSKAIIPAVGEMAWRLSVPEGVIAATLVAFGTSLPELVTAVTSALKGHGELGVGNIFGANTLNVLLVIGLSTAVTPGGMTVSPYFFSFLFPSMVLLLVFFKVGVRSADQRIKRPMGALLIGTYILSMIIAAVSAGG